MASEPGGGPPLPPVVLYDANLLYPFHLRNLLVQLGVDGLVAPRWTDRIHDEWVEPLPLKWSSLRYGFGQTEDARCRGSGIRPRRSSASCARSTC